MLEPSNTTILPALGAWKPAKDAGFHIPTATATAAVKLGQTVNPAPIVHFYRFLCRTRNIKARQAGFMTVPSRLGIWGDNRPGQPTNHQVGDGLMILLLR